MITLFKLYNVLLLLAIEVDFFRFSYSLNSNTATNPADSVENVTLFSHFTVSHKHAKITPHGHMAKKNKEIILKGGMM